MKSPKISEFSLIGFVGMSVLCVALFALRLLISFMISSFLRDTKRQTRIIWQTSLPQRLAHPY